MQQTHTHTFVFLLIESSQRIWLFLGEYSFLSVTEKLVVAQLLLMIKDGSN